MASIGRTLLLDENLSGNTTGGAKSLPALTTDHVAVLSISNVAGATVGGSIEHSPDKSNWFTLTTFAGGLSSDPDGEIQNISVPVLGNVRAVVTVAGGSADVKVELRHDSRSK